MKIDLTEEEWEFLKEYLELSKKYLSREYRKNIKESNTYKILEKLGSEWVDDE